MAVQTTYPEKMAAAFEGMTANTEPSVLISREVEGAALAFGKAVAQGAGDNQVTIVDDVNDIYRGIAMRDQSTDPASASSTPVGSSALIMTKGVVWVTAGAAVAAGEPVYVNPASGKFTNTDGGGVNLPLPSAVFDISGSADALQANLGFAQKQTSHIEAGVYKIRYPDLDYASLIPVDTAAGEWAKSVTYYSMDFTGRPKG